MISSKIRLMDGSFSTALYEQGYRPNDHKLWTGDANKLHPEFVYNGYKKFLEAGVDVITTNTYHSLIPLIRQFYGEDTIDDYNKSAVDLLYKAFDTVKPSKPVEILGSIGSYGASLRDMSEYTGSYVEEDGILEKMLIFYKEEIKKMEGYGLKNLVIETVPALLDCNAILKATQEAGKDTTFVISFSCKDGQQLNHGELFSEAVGVIISNPKIVGIGINCTPADHVSSLLVTVQGKTAGKEVFVYPNGYGQINLAEMSETDLRNLMDDWIKKGATVIGGCCRVSPDVIGKMRKILDSLQN